jgi:FkbM family methyltransferase
MRRHVRIERARRRHTDDVVLHDARDLRNPPEGAMPWWFRLGRYLSKRRVRGGDRLLRIARRRGWLDRLAVCSLGNGIRLRVPIWRPCNAWDEDDVLSYEAAFLRVLGAAISQLPGHVTLIDCGADIGTISAHLVARCTNIRTVVAFEPNPVAFGVLQQNLAELPVDATAVAAAVGDFCGRGRLISPAQDPSAHAMFVEPADRGEISVQRIDDLAVPPDTTCVIKIDVEGAEAAVVDGARRTIGSAAHSIVAFEAHPRVARRLGRDPVDIMQALLAIRPDFEFHVDTTPARNIVAHRPVFEQLSPDRNYNIVACSPV